MNKDTEKDNIESLSWKFWSNYLGQLVVGLIKSDLQILDFLAEVSDITVSLVRLSVVLLGGVLELLDGGVQAVRLALEALHLLPDGVHAAGAGGFIAIQGGGLQ